MTDICAVCGGTEFVHRPVLWPELVAEWGLTPTETAYVEHQQGTSCRACGAQIRGMALARAILAWLGETRPLRQALVDPRHAGLAIADMNGCAGVSMSFARLPNYHRLDYPLFDMQRLPFEPGTFDLLFHSDSLEHVADPHAALRECLRVLKPGGRLCFTAPVLVHRLTRSRNGLPPSRHGGPGDTREDFLVHSEFGADLWVALAEAGATSIAAYLEDFPSGIAWSAAVASAIETAPPAAAAAPVPMPAVAIPATGPIGPDHLYEQDGLSTRHNHEFMNDPAFQHAYARGIAAAGEDYRWHWRVHTGLWAARSAGAIPGDFVECGVNRGFLSSAIMETLDWDTTGRTFWLLDTFSGLDPRYVSEVERAEGILEKNRESLASGFYLSSAAAAEANFAQWRNQRIIVGAIPETLPAVTAERIAFLSIDMNCMPPEVAALEHFWDRLSDGAPVLLDDYAFHGYRQQKLGVDALAERLGVSVLSLPTGQGLIIKPPKARES